MLDLFKLEKLKIESHLDDKRSGADKTFEVMYNPSSFSLKHENVYQGRQDINGEGKREIFSYSRSSDLTLSLVRGICAVALFRTAHRKNQVFDSGNESVQLAPGRAPGSRSGLVDNDSQYQIKGGKVVSPATHGRRIRSGSRPVDYPVAGIGWTSERI